MYVCVQYTYLCRCTISQWNIVLWNRCNTAGGRVRVLAPKTKKRSGDTYYNIRATKILTHTTPFTVHNV